MAAATVTKRILVVDDERSVCTSVEKILVRRGHHVEKALSVASAVECLGRGRSFDLIIADLMMPASSGLDLLRIVCDRWPYTPLLIMTGYASIPSAVDATRAGAAGYLPKPFTPDELEAALAHALLSAKPSGSRPEVSRQQESTPMRVATRQAGAPDMRADVAEAARSISPRFGDLMTPSGIVAVGFCALGQRHCKRYRAKGVCQLLECPLRSAELREAFMAATMPHAQLRIDGDLPPVWAEALAVTPPAGDHAPGHGEQPASGDSEMTGAMGRRVLVVDDEPVVANSIRRILSRRGFTIDEAFSGREALTRVLSEMFDLVLLDMRMSDANGLDLLPTIRRHRPTLPVVMVTGYASIDTAVEAIRRGASDYMAKPFTPDELYAAARRAIDRA